MRLASALGVLLVLAAAMAAEPALARRPERSGHHAARPPRGQPSAHLRHARRPPARHAGTVAPVRAPVKTLPLIVVDAGHGGHDPGAVGGAGTLEKTVTLATATELARQLRATGRYRVLLTRTDDRFISLDRRVAIAGRSGAALMVSVHADSSVDRRAHGASVYVRSAQAPTGPAVRLPAQRGNSRAIARALTGATRPEPDSARLQLSMVASLDDDLSMTRGPARAARLHVLAALGLPSVLVEMGFISNPKDEALLRQPKHRAVIAGAIRDAVDDYFSGRGDPSGSRT